MLAAAATIFVVLIGLSMPIVFALGAAAGIHVACVLAVSDTFAPDGARRRIPEDALQEAATRMGAAAVAALS